MPPRLRFWQIALVGALLGGGLGSTAADAASTVLPPVTWAQARPATDPGPVANAGSAYDAATRQLVVFGGWNGAGFLRATWVWSGTSWRKASVSGPSAQANVSLAYDAATHQLVAFGGDSYSGGVYDFSSETWLWNGQSWTEAATTGPPARCCASMAYDEATHQLLLQDGYLSSDSDADDTWIWTGTTWKHLLPSTEPPAAADTSMAYDPMSGELLFFGGFSKTAGTLDQTWAWDGHDWRGLATPTAPPALEGASLVADPALGGLLLFGGFDPNTYPAEASGSTWLWGGRAWRQLEPASSPPGRGFASTAYFSLRRQLVVFGGMASQTNDDGAGTVLSDTWTMSSPPIGLEVTVLPRPRAGRAYSFVLRAKGGTGPYVFRRIAGKMAPGLHLTGNGEISGIPAHDGTYIFTVSIEDVSEFYGTANVTIDVLRRA